MSTLSRLMKTLGLDLSWISEPNTQKSVASKILNESNKGQIRNARPKPSGAAKLKRAATKRKNIRKNS